MPISSLVAVKLAESHAVVNGAHHLTGAADHLESQALSKSRTTWLPPHSHSILPDRRTISCFCWCAFVCAAALRQLAAAIGWQHIRTWLIQSKLATQPSTATAGGRQPSMPSLSEQQPSTAAARAALVQAAATVGWQPVMSSRASESMAPSTSMRVGYPLAGWRSVATAGCQAVAASTVPSGAMNAGCAVRC